MNHVTPKRSTLALAVCLAACLPAGHAFADTPLSLTVSETLTYDSNILRDNSNKYRDLVSSTYGEVAFEKAYGRQQYKAVLSASANRYKNSKGFDNDGFNLDLGFTTSLGSEWVVSLSHSQVKEMQAFADQGRERNKEIIDTSSTGAFIQYGAPRRWSPTLSLSQTSYRYDVATSQDRTSKYARLGMRYSLSDLLYVEGGLAKSTSDNPGILVPQLFTYVLGDPVKRTDLDISARWVVTGFSSLDSRLAWTDEKHENDELRNYKGLTGRATWAFTPAGKISYRLTADRDTNNAGGATNILTKSYQNKVTTGLSASAGWQATSKISASASVNFKQYKEEFQVQGLSNGGTSGTGQYTGLGLGLSYSPTRYSTLSCNLSTYNRTESVFSRAYDGESVACSAALKIDP
jgi:hypothetical protein